MAPRDCCAYHGMVDFPRSTAPKIATVLAQEVECARKQGAQRSDPGTARNADVDELKTIAIFCGLGLLLSLIAATRSGLGLAAFS